MYNSISFNKWVEQNKALGECRAITVIQPWAYYLSTGEKQYETRSWQTNYRGPILIHAGLNEKFLPQEEITPYYALGALVGAGILEGCYKTELIRCDLSDDEIELGDFDDNRFAWKITNVVQFESPVIMRGKQGLWKFVFSDEEYDYA